MNKNHDSENKSKTLLAATTKTETGQKRTIIITKFGKGEKIEIYLDVKKIHTDTSRKPLTDEERIGVINCHGFTKSDIVEKPDFRDKNLNPLNFGGKVIVDTPTRGGKGKRKTEKGIIVGEYFSPKHMEWCLKIRTKDKLIYKSHYSVRRGNVMLDAPTPIQPFPAPYTDTLQAPPPPQDIYFERVFPVMRLTRKYLAGIGLETHKMSDNDIHNIAAELEKRIKGIAFDSLVRLVTETVMHDTHPTHLSSKSKNKEKK